MANLTALAALKPLVPLASSAVLMSLELEVLALVLLALVPLALVPLALVPLALALEALVLGPLQEEFLVELSELLPSYSFSSSLPRPQQRIVFQSGRGLD